jgi:drug/metabolite transporter (DMT)-like permease
MALQILAVSISLAKLYARLRHHFFDHVYAPPSVVLESLGAASFYAVAAVLQQSAASEQPASGALGPALLLGLLRRRRWLIGNAASAAGFVLQFLALRRGSLALVEPLLVASLVIALPLSAVVAHRRLSLAGSAPGLLIVVALALFLLSAQPGPGRPHASAAAWILLGCLTFAVVAGCVHLAGPDGARRALFLGAGAGILFGVTGAIIETTGHLLDHGLLYAVSNWAPYALIVVSVGGLLLNQAAYQAGQIAWSLPVLTILEPLVAIAIGEFMFGEHVAGGVFERFGELLGLLGMAAGVAILSRRETASPG